MYEHRPWASNFVDRDDLFRDEIRDLLDACWHHLDLLDYMEPDDRGGNLRDAIREALTTKPPGLGAVTPVLLSPMPPGRAPATRLPRRRAWRRRAPRRRAPGRRPATRNGGRTLTKAPTKGSWSELIHRIACDRRLVNPMSRSTCGSMACENDHQRSCQQQCQGQGQYNSTHHILPVGQEGRSDQDWLYNAVRSAVNFQHVHLVGQGNRL